jgi:hypothetical protein
VSRLQNNVTRCPEREACQRWIDRDWPPHAVRVVHAASLRTLNADGACAARVPARGQEAA